MAYTTIDDPSAYHHTQLYTGDGNTNRDITNDANAGDFQPDMLWIKSRSLGDVNHHLWYSSVSMPNHLSPDQTYTEATATNKATVLNADGFRIQDHSSVNGDGATYTAWQWIVNGGTRVTFTESGNNPGGGYQVSTKAGISIVDYTGTGSAGTVTHGLGAVPHVIILKCRSDAHDWQVGHDSIASDAWTDYLNLNTTGAAADYAGHWNDTAPTSTVFTLGDNAGLNGDGLTFIAFCFTPIQGFSHFGGYKGNGNADGTFIYMGFKPAWIMVKSNADGDSWYIWDNKTNPFNADGGNNLWAEGTYAENTDDYAVDAVSNGFKIRATTTNLNASGRDYNYLAFAENPFVSSGGVPCTAR